MTASIQQAIRFIETGKLDRAHASLLEILQADPKNDAAWYWMSKVVATTDLREECLQEALKYNPQNKLAQAALDGLADQPAAAPVSKWDTLAQTTPNARSPLAAPRQRSNTLPAAISLFVIALVLAGVTYAVTREDLAYRSEGRVVSATVIKLNKERGSTGVPDRCEAAYQFMAYGALRQGTVPIACAEWDHLDDVRRLQIQYLISQPDRSRVYPPAQTTERYAVMGFGLAALLIVSSLVLIVWRFWPVKATS